MSHRLIEQKIWCNCNAVEMIENESDPKIASKYVVRTSIVFARFKELFSTNRFNMVSPLSAF